MLKFNLVSLKKVYRIISISSFSELPSQFRKRETSALGGWGETSDWADQQEVPRMSDKYWEKWWVKGNSNWCDSSQQFKPQK